MDSDTIKDSDMVTLPTAEALCGLNVGRLRAAIRRGRLAAARPTGRELWVRAGDVRELVKPVLRSR